MPRKGPVDLVTLEILWDRLIGVTNEQAAALMRASFTPIVRDIGDLSAAAFDAQGRMIAQSVTGTPGHINSLATGMRHFLAAHPADTLHDGDVLITNDPWMTSGQLNDISVVTPVFRYGRLVGFFGNCCHAIDIGGRGLSADATEVFEEGLQIPITKLYRAGDLNGELVRLLRANVRAPEEVMGDLHAQVAGNQVGADRLLEYLDELGLEDLDELSEEILARSERSMRESIRGLPDGDYDNTCYTDGIDEPIRIHVVVRVRGDEITADFEGSSGQVELALNVVLNYTAAYTNYALKCALCPDVPQNEGSFRPVKVVAPEGSIFNPTFPAAVAARQIAGHFVPHAVLGAIAPVAPTRVIAEGAGGIWLTTVRGISSRFASIFFSAGGMGAGAAQDGLSATAFPSAVATAPVEVLEAGAPLLFRRKELRQDSGGAGEHRGGLGQTIEVELHSESDAVVSVLSDRFVHAAHGYNGGRPGARSEFRVSGEVHPDPKRTFRLPAGASFVMDLPGGGGFGDAAKRDRALLAEDVREGLVSEEAAAREYGGV